MKKIAFLIMIAVATMACDKISDAPVAGRETAEQEQNIEMAADATSDKDMADDVKGTPVDPKADITNEDKKFDSDSKSQF